MTEKNEETLKILHLEDDAGDARLIRDILDEAGLVCSIDLVNSREEFEKALAIKKFDLILCDNSLPSFSGTGALLIARGVAPDTPFVFVTGTMGEESAVQTLIDGATDYVLKPGLQRLVPAVKRAVREADERRKLKLAEKMREMALEDLRNLEAKYRGVLETAPDAVIIVDQHYEITFVNEQARQTFGYTAEELLGKSLAMLVPERLRKKHETELSTFSFHPHARSMGRGLDLYARRKDGTEFPADIMLSPFVSKDETAVLAMIRDLTEVREAEGKLKSSEERYRTIYEASPLAITNVDENGKYVRCNPAAVKLFGYSEEELLKMSFNDMTYPDDRGIGPSFLAEQVSGKREIVRFEKRFVRKDGRVIIANLTAATARDAQGRFTHSITIIDDITEKKAAETALRASEEQYRGLVDGVRDAIFSLTLDGIIRSLNPAFENMTGWSRSEWIGRGFVELLHADDVPRAEAALRSAAEGETPGVVEFRISAKDGGSLIGEFNIAAQMKNGRVVGLLGIARDVTEQKSLEEQLRQSQKLEGLGTLAGGVAHDFNNILAIINGYTSFLRRIVEGNEKASACLNSISSAAGRAVGLVRQLLMFARKQERIQGYVDVSEVAGDLCKLIRETFPRQIEIVTDLRKSGTSIYGDRSEIHQLLLNLCVNARDAMMDRTDGQVAGGRLGISAEVVKGNDAREKFPAPEYQEYVKISVSDTGMGMDEGTRSRIFEPFFTTKPEGKGTGLGLSTVYGIVQSQSGFVDVSSTPGKGTTFVVYLPASSDTATSRGERLREASDIRGGNETILVVEDEPGLREYLLDLLSAEGYKVLAAKDGESAISLFLNQSDIKLVISDIGLPKIGGLDLMATIKMINPGTRVILASGFLEESERLRMEKEGVKMFIQKPYERDDLLNKVRSALDEAR